MANLFYSIGKIFGLNTKQQIKQFFDNKITYLGRKDAIYLDVDVPYILYNQIPELNQVVNKKAKMMSNGVFKLRNRSTGKEIVNNELMVLLNKPNVMQGTNDFIINYQTQLDIYGNQFIYKNKPTALSKYPKSLKNISPRWIKVIPTGKYFDQESLDGIIKSFEYQDNNNFKRTIETTEIIWSKIDDLDDPIIGTSPLKSLKFPLTNTKLAYDYLNVISGEKGAIGMVSGSTKDNFGALPMSQEDKQELEKQYTEDYGVQEGQRRIKIVSSPVSWQPMTYPTRDLLLMEQIDANKLTICDHFGLNINIFSSKNATFENVKNGLIQSYNDSVYPAADGLCQSLHKGLGLKEDEELYLDYSHISILQPDKGLEADILTKQLNSVKDAVAGGLITVQQAQSIYNNSFGLKF
jgi:HK97 family phage portal protein